MNYALVDYGWMRDKDYVTTSLANIWSTDHGTLRARLLHDDGTPRHKHPRSIKEDDVRAYIASGMPTAAFLAKLREEG